MKKYLNYFVLILLCIQISDCKYDNYDCSEGCKFCPPNKAKVGDGCIDLKKEGFYYCTSPCICLDTMAIAFSDPVGTACTMISIHNFEGKKYSIATNCNYYKSESGDRIVAYNIGKEFCSANANDKAYPVVTGRFINKSYWDIVLEWHSVKTDTVVTTCNLIFKQ